MRWPFANWLRGAPGGDDTSPGASAAAGSAAAPDPGPGPRAALRQAAWRDVPPLRRAVGAAPLTAPSTAFARDLAGRRAPDPMIGPLGHDLTADGPAGLVSGIAVPLVQRAPSGSGGRPVPALPAPAAFERGRPTARRTVTSVAAWPPSDDVEGTTAGAERRETAEEAIAGLPAGAPAADVPILVSRTLPVAWPAMSTPALSATRVADATAPAPVLAVARAVAPGAPFGSAEPLPAASSVSAAAVGPTPGAASGSAPETAAGVPPAPAGPDDPARPVVSRRTLGASRRLGLGAPLTGRPPSAATEAGRADLSVARLSRATDASGRGLASASTAAAMPPAASAAASLPRLVVARRATNAPGFATTAPTQTGAPDPGSEGTPGDAPAPTASEHSARDPGVGETAGVTRPLVGGTLIGVSPLARDGSPADADAEGTVEPGGPAFPLVGASGSAPVALGAEATAVPAGPTGSAAVQRSHVGPAGGEPARSDRASLATRTAPALAPLVPGRTMRASQPGAISTLRLGPAGEPAPVVARLAIPSLAAGGGRDAGPILPGDAMGSRGLPAGAVGTQRDERPVVSRVAQAGGAGPSSTATPALTLSRSTTGSAMPAADVTGGSHDGASWTAATGFSSVAAAPSPFVQRAVTIDEMTVTPGGDAAGAAGAAGAGAAAGQGGPPGASGGGAAGTDYEELAEQVYDKIRARLTTELLLDRERAGMLVDG